MDALTDDPLPLPPFVGVVTYNPMSTLRFELLDRTVRSIEKAFPTAELFLLDNGSTDGSWDAVQELLGRSGIECAECGGARQRGRWHVQRGGGEPTGNFTPGAGCHRLYYHMFGHTHGGRAQAPFWAFSDDDLVWKEGSEARLRRFWDAARDTDIAILGGLLEPVWHWNTPREAIEYGGVRAVVRDSAPGAGWTLGEPRFLPVPSNEELHCFGFDYEACKILRTRGYKVAQMDLAEHIGWGFSTHGNEANQHLDGRPLDRDKWGV